MDFSVVIDDLAAHGRDVGQAGTTAAVTLGTVRLDAAAAAMPGSLSAPASEALQARFSAAGRELSEALSRYAAAADQAAADYRKQEERSAEAISNFFGQA
ncbi:hypothetical protein FOJ82_10960 [Tessaracoccus rhinocerotis]|uniref:ESX-1 secretion-associated protein n=1 Tax=Tessaracoccus rhinocerotis TaxID=1689449 RepID=A0A553JZ95_9ACTN|nr:hypothetical protein [Tessaracoccus rhinocerotis]TRY17786.1 hypothetical protein FOJ82_10960 [Tessaracoccus rhinocerotis]